MYDLLLHVGQLHVTITGLNESLLRVPVLHKMTVRMETFFGPLRRGVGHVEVLDLNCFFTFKNDLNFN